jgi:hypothetical protein
MLFAKTQTVLAVALLASATLYSQIEEMDLYTSSGQDEVIDLGEMEPWRQIIYETSCLSGHEKARAISLFEKLPFIDWHQLQADPNIDPASVRCMVESHQEGRILRYRKEWDEKTRLSYIYRHGEGFFEGYHLLRLKSALSSQVRVGFILERDQGEKFWFRNGPAYWGGFLEWNMASHRIKRLIAGDYKVTLGQGLLFNNQFRKGLVHGHGQLPVIDHSWLLPFQGVDENRGLRGLAMEMKWHKLKSVVFLSSRHQDASINEDNQGIRTLQYSGLHTTESAEANRDRLWVSLAGMGLSYEINGGQVSLNQILHYQDQPWAITNELRNEHDAYSTSFYGLSLSHRFQWETMLVYGEIAYQPGRAPGFTQGVILNAGKQSWSLITRHLPKEYIAQYTQGLFRSAFRNNETGLFLGYVFHISKIYEFSMNYDHAIQPWWSFSSGPDRFGGIMTLRLSKKLRKRSNQSLRISIRSDHPSDGKKTWSFRTRYHITKKLQNGLEWRTRSEIGVTQTSDFREYSWLHYQEVKWSRLGAPWQGLVRMTLYESDSFNGRLYAYEHRLGGNFLIPPFYGKGLETYLMLKYKAGPVKLSTRVSLRNRVREEISTSALGASFSIEWSW